MHSEKFQVDKTQNRRLLAIIHLDRPDIANFSWKPLKIAAPLL